LEGVARVTRNREVPLKNVDLRIQLEELAFTLGDDGGDLGGRTES